MWGLEWRGTLWLTLTRYNVAEVTDTMLGAHLVLTETLCISAVSLGALPSLQLKKPRLASLKVNHHMEQLRPFWTSQPQLAWQLPVDT